MLHSHVDYFVVAIMIDCDLKVGEDNKALC
jgi:hypothetical protein